MQFYISHYQWCLFSKTPITLKVVHSTALGVGQNNPVLQLPSEVCMLAYDTMAKRPIP